MMTNICLYLVDLLYTEILHHVFVCLFKFVGHRQQRKMKELCKQEETPL